MRIGIDASVLEKNSGSGVGRYLQVVLDAIPKLDNNEYFLFSNKTLTYSNSFYKTISTNYNIPSGIFLSYWLHFILPRLLKKNKIDLLFGPNQLLPFRKLNAKSVVVVHDVFNKVDKDYLPFLYRNKLNLELPITIKRSDKIISDSENTKRDLIKYYNVDDNKIRVILNGINDRYCEINLTKEEKDNIRSKYNLPEKFILYVGGIEKRKNILGVLKITELTRLQQPEIKTVIIGKPAHGGDTLIREIEMNKESVVYIPFVNNEDLVKIYNMAFVFLFPSYYEGLGLPPVEAMKCGLPVLTSNTSTFPDIIGDAGILLPPDEHTLFVENIVKLSQEPAFYHEMKLKSLNWSSKFSVEDSTREIIDVLQQTL